MNQYLSRARRIVFTAAASLLLTGCSGLFSPSDQDALESLFGSSDQPLTIDQGAINRERSPSRRMKSKSAHSQPRNPAIWSSPRTGATPRTPLDLGSTREPAQGTIS